ncbi:flagellar biosynthetic protein FliR [Alphaproteobacteria bacterium]|jgi:flagellar biosynthetic protein FliR|nr:flagellar biosynthetic protein FliR [Alphaproteobacteria bacterium]
MLPLVTQNMVALPGLDLQWIVSHLVQYLVASLRIGAFMISSPMFGARWMPLQIRIIMSFMLAMSVAGQVDLIDVNIITSLPGIIIMATEITIGLAAGLVLTIWFAGALLAGEKIASSAGLGFAAQVDPSTGGQTPVVSQILYLFLTVIFLSLDGHLMVIRLMLESYSALPLGHVPDMGVLVEAGVSAAGSMFFVGAIIMLPVVIILLMINVSIGVITRSAPQLNLFSFGFPISMLGVFVVLYFSADTLSSSMADLVFNAIGDVQTMMENLANG